MSRLVMPNVFEAWGAPIVVEDTAKLALRWMLAAEVGLPSVPFQVWGWVGPLPVVELPVSLAFPLPDVRTVRWAGGRVAAVQVRLDVAAEVSVVVRGLTGPNGAGQVADLVRVTGPVAGQNVVLAASAISSVTVTGQAAIAPTVSAIPVSALVEGTGWRLLDRVGLPADARFAGLYSLEPQGPAGVDLTPADAAVARVKAGLPDDGWPVATDVGSAPPAFVAPDPTAVVGQEFSPLLDSVAALLTAQPDPALQADTWVDVGMRAPISIHGVAGSARWQQGAAGRVQPLGSLRFSAATDPASALALGFGTTVSTRSVQGAPAVSGVPGVPALKPADAAHQAAHHATHASAVGVPRVLLHMVTVAHKVALDLPVVGEVVVEGELTAFHFAREVAGLDAPVGLAATRTGLDRPAAVDRPWLELADVSWFPPVRAAAQHVAPSAYAVLRADGTGAPECLLEKRISGGFHPFAAASAAGDQPATRVRYGDRGIPELFPGEDPNLVYSVAAQDWFGRWSPWRSVGHDRVAVAPQVPSVANAQVEPDDAGGPGAATLSAEVTWDWANRSPAALVVRALVEAAPAPSGLGSGSVLAVGGPVVADLVVDFGAATPDAPPPGAPEIVERRTGTLRSYRVAVPITVDHSAAERIDVRVAAASIERVRPTVQGAFSGPAATTSVSPLPPPPPFVPATMVWASLPDPAGICRVALSWTATGASAATWAVYTADETAVTRELGLPSPDLDVPAADRLVALRSRNLGSARRAFRRAASALAATAHAVELPRGSRLIHFYAVVGASASGIESAFPLGGNDFLAVATPTLLAPEVPAVTARATAGQVLLEVAAAQTLHAVDRVEVFRVTDRLRAGTLEAAGPAVLVLPASVGVHSAGVVRWSVIDPGPVPTWTTVTYRAVAWAAADFERGEVAGRSAPTAAVEVVVQAAAPPALDDLTVTDLGEPGLLLAGAATAAPRERTSRGAHQVAVTVLEPGAVVSTRRASLDTVPLVVGPLPATTDLPGGAGAIFFHHPTDPAQARLSTRIPSAAVGLTIEVADPAGRATRVGWSAP